MNNSIAANELKTRGVKILEEIGNNTDVNEILVNVRGKTKYAILSIESAIERLRKISK